MIFITKTPKNNEHKKAINMIGSLKKKSFLCPFSGSLSPFIPEKTQEKYDLPAKTGNFAKRPDLSEIKETSSAVGSLTIETALVLPIFMFAMLSVAHLTEGVRFSSVMSAALCEVSTEYAKFSYAYSKGISGGDLSGRVIGVAAAGSAVLNRIGEDYLTGAPVSGGKGGISFLRSSVLDRDETIDLVASYRISTPYNFPGFTDIKVTDRARVRAFTGYDNTKKGSRDDEEPDEMVFITETGSVYHRERGCRHLKLNIMTTTVDAVGDRRANDGSRYYPCSCASGIKSGIVYITDDGNRYHSNLGCSSLKRTIYEVPLKEVSGRTPCKSCGR